MKDDRAQNIEMEQVLRRERDFHDRHAGDYQAHISNARNRVLIALRARMFGKWLKPGVLTAELGAGVGTWSRHFEKRVPLVSVDFSRQSLDLLKSRAQKATPVQADVRNLPFRDHSLKQVFVGMVLHHLPFEYRSQALEELCRVLAPGGRLIVHEPNRDIQRSLSLWIRRLKRNRLLAGLLRPFRAEYDHAEESPLDREIGRNDDAPETTGIEPQGFRADELCRFLGENGFRILKVGYLHSIQLPTPRWFGLQANRLVVSVLHTIERVLLSNSRNISHFMYVIADRED